MQAAIAAIPAKRLNDANPSSSKKPKLERSGSMPHLADALKGQVPEWALKNYPLNMKTPPSFPGGNMGVIRTPSNDVSRSRPSSAQSSIGSQQVNVDPDTVNDKGKKDSEKLDVDSMMDATTYGGVDLKVTKSNY